MSVREQKAETRALKDSKENADPQNPPAEQDSTDAAARPREIGGREGPDPTRYGDWEKDGRCIDF